MEIDTRCGYPLTPHDMDIHQHPLAGISMVKCRMSPK